MASALPKQPLQCRVGLGCTEALSAAEDSTKDGAYLLRGTQGPGLSPQRAAQL